MGIVDDPIEYGVGEGRLADDIVPCIDGQLAGEQDRAVAVAILDDLHEVASLPAGEPVGPQSSRISGLAQTSFRNRRGKLPSP